MEIPKTFTDLCNMKTLKESLAIYGDVLDTYIVFFDTFLIQSDKRVLQYLRECSLNISTSLTYDEYLELEKYRQYCVEYLREQNEA